MANGKVSSKRSTRGPRKFKSMALKWKFFIILGILGLGTGIGCAIYYGYQFYTGFAVGPGPGPTLATSIFEFYSGVDGEDVSDFTEGSIWIPKDTATFDDTEDIYTLTNFEETKSSMDAEDISIDLRNIQYAWLEINPDGEGVFSNTYILLFGGKNYVYKESVYDLTTDVNFNIMDEDTMAAITVGNLTMSGGYVATLDCPHDTETAAQLHVGTNWDMEQSEFDELSATQQAWYYDEKNVAGQYPLYSPVIDLEKEYHSDLEKVTNAFALKFDFNTTISTEDGNSAQVNASVAATEPVEVVISGDLIYFIWYEGFDFENGAVSLYFDMSTNAGIGLDDVDSGRITVPRDDDSLGPFVKYSDIAT